MSGLRLSGRLEPLAAKVPEITLLFWIVKVLTTGIGESSSDFLGQVSVPLAGLVGIGGLILGLLLQLRARTTTHRPTGSRSSWSRSSARWRPMASTTEPVSPTP